MTEPSAQEQTTTTNHAPANVEVDTSKKVGAWNQTQAEANGFEAAALAPLTRFKQWRKEEVIFLASKARADGRNRNIHMMFNFYVVYAQRPEN
ncbi:hypothetical protein VTN31DRAFT_6793 [Thermomyces dupontii]|uniref:uncharacterized protein n=1 Tax=Talaromyces thermophilus TaxID=28565 RepID=UPI003742DD3B